MRRALAVILLLAGCKEAHAPARVSTPDLALPAGWSRGFGAAPAAPAPPAPPVAAAAPDRDDDEPEVTLPPELSKRPAPKAGVAVYVDGAVKRTLSPAELTPAKRLDAVAGGAARSLLAHGANGNLWLGGPELARYQLRLNRRGQVKLEPVDAAGGGKKRGQAGHDAPPDRAGRPHELRDILWLEVRTPKSALLAGEPRTP